MAKGKLIFNDRDGWSYERDGRTYDLLEGVSLGGHSSSVICFVMETDENGYIGFTTWFCCDGLSPSELLEVCDQCITGQPVVDEQIEKLKKENDRLHKIIESVKNAVR